jgi:hypothetical protein
VSISANGLAAILHCKVYVRSAYTVAGLEQLADYIVLPFTRKSTAATELCKLKVIEFLTKADNLVIQLLTSGRHKGEIVILHTEINFVDNLKQINLELHCREDGTVHLNVEFGAIKPAVYISAERAPETKELNVVLLDKAKSGKIVELLVAEGERAKMVNLCIDFLTHFLGKLHTAIAALEDILTVEISVLMEHHLVHIKLIEVSIKQRYDARREFHHSFYSFFLSFSINIISFF